jgi:hypothetical protein
LWFGQLAVGPPCACPSCELDTPLRAPSQLQKMAKAWRNLHGSHAVINPILIKSGTYAKLTIHGF